MGRLSPEDKYRRAKGLGPNVPVPVNIDGPRLQRGYARNLEMQRDEQTERARTIESSTASRGRPGVSQPPSYLEIARTVLDNASLGADIATIGLAAGGITAPVAGAAKGLSWAAEGGLGLVNLYDCVQNKNCGPLEAQVAGLGSRLLPGGRVLQKGLKIARGPTGLLRDGAGKFRTSVLNNRGIEEAGDAVRDRLVGEIASKIYDR